MSRIVSCKSRAGLSRDVCSDVQTRDDENFVRTSCSVGPRASSDGRQNGLLELNLTKTVYMVQPEGFTEGNDKVCLLQRSVYGLKQTGRDWYQTLSSF